MKLINEKDIYNSWAPMIKSQTSIDDERKINWLSKYAHYHSLNENVFNNGYSVLSSLSGQGPVAFPANPNGAGQPFWNGATGSGDKFPSLLPLAIQVAARTVGFDIVSVIPMSSPSGVLPYLDYIYTDGKLNSGADKPTLIKVDIQRTGSTPFVIGTTYFVRVDSSSANNSVAKFTFVGKSRVDGFAIFRINDGAAASSTTISIDDIFTAANGYELYLDDANASTAIAIETTDGVAYTSNILSKAFGKQALVKALEDHIYGPTGAGPDDTNTWFGNFTEPNLLAEPMDRGTGETTYYRSMGVKTYTKAVEAKTYQIAAEVTTEQIQDLNKQYSIDLLAMVENALVNDVSQSINKHILTRGFALGVLNAVQFSKVELGQTSNYTGLNIDLTTTTTSSATVSAIAANGTNYTMGYSAMQVLGSNNAENYQTQGHRIYLRILAAGNIISNRGGKGPANFVVTNNAVATTLQYLANYQPVAFANTINQNNGSLYPVGTIAGMTVYVDPNMKWNDTRVLVGRKGSDDEPGMKFMPYLMAESIQTIESGTMAPKLAIKSRYALVEAGQLPQTFYFTFFVKIGNGGLIG